MQTKYISTNDRYTPTRESYDSVEVFLDMCEDGFGERPELTRNGAGYWTDETGQTVLEEEELDDDELAAEYYDCVADAGLL